jgi:hypothetical protein
LPEVVLEVQTQEGCPKIFVKKWCDYSTKYGLAYMLSDGSVGVNFNDKSCILAHPDSDMIMF